jgi:hypothetical protein
MESPPKMIISNKLSIDREEEMYSSDFYEAEEKKKVDELLNAFLIKQQKYN